MKKIFILALTAFTSISTFSGTIIPFEREVSRIDRFSFITGTYSASKNYRVINVGDENDNLYFQGFNLENKGPNDIVPTAPHEFFYAYREFAFVNTDKSRRDNHLWITDHNGSGQVFDLYETVLVFLPRENQMHIEEHGENLIVTLNNGEEIHYSKNGRKITSGVFKESPVDYNPNRAERSFAKVSYHGKGIVLRSDAQGGDPRLSASLQIMRNNKEPCVVPGSTFWTNNGFPKFRFVSDEEAYKAIEENCGKEFLR